MKNNRTFLEKLLDGAEVKWMPLDEVANIANNARKPVKSSLRISGNIPYYGANNIQDYVEGYTHDGEFVLIAEDGSASLENYSIQWAVGKFWANNHVHVVNGKEKLNNRFLYHYLTNMNFIPFLAGKERAKLTKAKLQQIPIPIPPLPVQTEIVKILDALTALTSELTSELILRRKQYEYYREKLLSFDSLEQLNMGGAKKKLIDVAIYAKVRILADKLDKENYVGVENLLQNKLGKTSSNYVPTDGAFIEYLPNDILIGNIRPYLRKIWLSDRKGGTNGDVLVIRLTDENILPRYLYHILANEHFFEYNIKYSKGAKMPRGDKSAILQYEFDVPPLEQQQRIVSILDKFETLTNSITDGLPLAIEQSQKRYEYYRELLLSFS